MFLFSVSRQRKREDKLMGISSALNGSEEAPHNPNLMHLVNLAKGEGSRREEFLFRLAELVNDPHLIIRARHYKQLNELCVFVNKNGFQLADLFAAAAWLNSCEPQERIGGYRGL